MKKFAFTILFLAIQLVVSAQDGVNFRKISFKEALETAKAEKKLVFMDCYTSWCGPCKMMLKTVFSQKAAGEFFNPKFICIKVDMEKGEGPDLKKALGVKAAYPTFLILQPDGTEIARIVGGAELDEFIGRIERSLDEKKSLSWLSQKYQKKGRLKSRELMDYYTTLNENSRTEEAANIGKILEKQMKEKEMYDPYFWKFITESSGYGSKTFNLVRSNTATFKKKVGKEKVEAYLDNIYYDIIYRSVFTGLPQDAGEFKSSLEKLETDRQPLLMLDYSISEALAGNHTDKVLDILSAHTDKMTGKELKEVIQVLNRIQNNASKAQFGRMGDFLQKIIPLQEKESLATYLKALKDDYYRQASKGTCFTQTTLEEALNTARLLNKHVFIDCYTSWCGPCKYMLGHVFPQEKVGNLINRKFVPLKMNVEHGEGLKLKEKFGIHAYPTFLVLNPDGTIYHKIVGGGQADEFIKMLDVAPEKTSVALRTKYKQGVREKHFMLDYVKSLQTTNSPYTDKVAKELYDSLTDEEKTSPDFWYLFNGRVMSSDSYVLPFLIAKKATFYEKIGRKEVEDLLSRKFMSKFRTVYQIPSKDKKKVGKKILPQLKEMEKEIRQLDLSCEKTLLAHLKISTLLLKGDFRNLLTVSEQEIMHIKPEEFPFFGLMTAKLPHPLTAAEKERVARLGNYLIEHIGNGSAKTRLEKAVKSL